MDETPAARDRTGPPAPKGTVTQRAIDRIKAMIGEGLLEPGQRLPTERDLAAQLGISRSSMREAIRALTVLGVLEARHGSGIYVTRLEAGDLLETFGVVADLSRGAGLVEILEVRRILESTAAALAAARMTPERLAEVEGHLAAMNATDDPEEIIAHDLAFHRAIAAAAGNGTMAAILEGLSSRTFRARVWRGYQEEGAFARTRREHAAIHRALAARDPEAARTAAAAHVGEVEQWLRAQLPTDAP
ncbi:FCD domain-containing protein [Streptomyces sp. NPDC005840]|uniref:FCD domain-containing protein n=2 Tax=Streptomyces TaxID=1883 RepID=A0ABD5EI80_9ACTN|nr:MULTISPECIES: FCD domain-containing protein [unclassified Streptomyces]MDT0433479.1 FCD domain-containing protein [Streptomyces sp. DSM 41981]MYQ65470.1 FCD domain-containing protein [Streptomyces sp. SID4950]SCE00723.1 transcriptional regulator, GntR family [Streptomyces sp. SolWspMP-5a-2]